MRVQIHSPYFYSTPIMYSVISPTTTPASIMCTGTCTIYISMSTSVQYCVNIFKISAWPVIRTSLEGTCGSCWLAMTQSGEWN